MFIAFVVTFEFWPRYIHPPKVNQFEVTCHCYINCTNYYARWSMQTQHTYLLKVIAYLVTFIYWPDMTFDLDLRFAKVRSYLPCTYCTIIIQIGTSKLITYCWQVQNIYSDLWISWTWPTLRNPKDIFSTRSSPTHMLYQVSSKSVYSWDYGASIPTLMAWKAALIILSVSKMAWTSQTASGVKDSG